MTFDRVSKHRSRHRTIVLAQEVIQNTAVAFSHLAQHPANRFVDQIMGVLQQQLGDPNSWSEFIPLDEMKSGDDRDAPFPDALRSREALQGHDVARSKVRANDVLG